MKHTTNTLYTFYKKRKQLQLQGSELMESVREYITLSKAMGIDHKGFEISYDTIIITLQDQDLRISIDYDSTMHGMFKYTTTFKFYKIVYEYKGKRYVSNDINSDIQLKTLEVLTNLIRKKIESLDFKSYHNIFQEMVDIINSLDPEEVL